MTETLKHRKHLIREYLTTKSLALDSQGRDFLEMLLYRTPILTKMYFTKNAYYIRDRVLVGTSRYYSPRFYFRFDSFNINPENIFADDRPTKFRAIINKRSLAAATRDIKPENIFYLLEQLPYWFLQVDEDFAEQHYIGEGFTTQRILETPCLYRLLTEAQKSVARKERRRHILMKHIDRSLAVRNKRLFMHLTAQLKKLSC